MCVRDSRVSKTERAEREVRESEAREKGRGGEREVRGEWREARASTHAHVVYACMYVCMYVCR
jgi:hypothetical protein